jgi:hypothetical protein
MPYQKSTLAWMLSATPWPWGDYGHVLVHGISRHLGRDDGTLQLERTGPFVPPITLPTVAEIVVTEALRRDMEAEGLTGATFRPVRLARAVRLDWERWDRSAPLPQHPPTGEPESFVLDRPSDSALAESMAPLWELSPDPWGKSARVATSGAPSKYEVTLVPDSGARMPDIFRAPGTRYTFLSNRGAAWLGERAKEWVRTQPVSTETS